MTSLLRTYIINRSHQTNQVAMLKGPEIDWGIPREPLGKLFLNALNNHEKSRKAVIDTSSQESYTYEQLLEYSKNLACHLRNFGIGKNDTIGIVSGNSRKFCVVILAAFYVAAPIHLINPGYTEYEFREILKFSKPKLVFCSKKGLPNLQKLEFIEKIIPLDDEAFEKFTQIPQTPLRIEENIDSATHTATIANSSGTTGTPKGVMQSHDYCRYLLGYAGHRDFVAITRETLPVIAPFFHTYGLFTMIASIFHGATIVTFSHFQPELYLETIQKHKAEKLFLVPSLIGFFLSSPLIEKHDLSSVRCVISGGASVLPTEKAQLRNKLRMAEFHEIYASTETGIIAKSSGESPAGSCGRVSPNSLLKIIDTETSDDLAANQTGEICFKAGYVTDKDGFFRTGDTGHYDLDGFVYVTGRVKDLIKYKAFQVSPLEIEKVLLAHEAVRDAAVVGKPDRRAGEVAVAFVVAADGAAVTEQDVCEHVARFLCAEKRLHGGVKFVGEIPRNTLGKVLRRDLVEALMKEER